MNTNFNELNTLEFPCGGKSTAFFRKENFGFRGVESFVAMARSFGEHRRALQVSSNRRRFANVI